MVSPGHTLAINTIYPSLRWEQPERHGLTVDFSDIFTVTETPSPPISDSFSTETPTDVSVSTAFYSGAHGLDADLVFISSDSVLFYVHSRVLSAASEHAFRPILPTPLSDRQNTTPVVHVPDTSIILNIIILALYGMSSAQYSPSFTALVTAVDQMACYEIEPKRCITLTNPLHAQLLSHAPSNPLELYALAARHDIYDIAAQASSHLISYRLNALSDEMAMQIGALYLKHLLRLHVDRLDALRNIILVPVFPHSPTAACDFDAQQLSLTKAWATAVSSLASDARPDLSVAHMRFVFAPLQNQLTCVACRANFSDRVEDVILQWSAVKCTI